MKHMETCIKVNRGKITLTLVEKRQRRWAQGPIDNSERLAWGKGSERNGEASIIHL